MRLASGFLLGAASQGLNLLGAIATRILLWRLLGPQAYGGVAISLNVVTVISRVFSFGLAPATQHFGSKLDSRRASVGVTALRLGIATGVLLTLATYGCLPLLGSYLGDEPTATLAMLWLAAGILPVVVTAILMSLLLSWGRYAHYNLVATTIGTGVPVLLVAASAFTNPTAAAIGAHLTCWAVAVALGWLFTRPATAGGHWQPDLARLMTTYGLASWPTIILAVGAARLATLLGVSYVGVLEIGYFILAVNVTEALFTIFSPTSQLLFTQVSAREAASFGVARRAARLSTPIFLGVAVLYAGLGKPVFVFALGDDAVPAWPLSLILLLAATMHALTRITASINAGLGRPHLNLIALGCEVATLLVLLPLLAPGLGATGLALASVASAAVGLVVGTVQVCSTMRVTPRGLWVPSPEDIAFLRRRLGEGLRELRRTSYGGK